MKITYFFTVAQKQLRIKYTVSISFLSSPAVFCRLVWPRQFPYVTEIICCIFSGRFHFISVVLSGKLCKTAFMKREEAWLGCLQSVP